MKPAIKSTSGKIVPAKRKGQAHIDIGPVSGERGFVHKGKFLNREQAAKIAKVPGISSLHSHHLKDKK